MKLCCVCCPSVVIAAVCGPSVMIGKPLVLLNEPTLPSALSRGSVTFVPPPPSDDIVKLCCVYCSSVVIVAVCVPSVIVGWPLVLLNEPRLVSALSRGSVTPPPPSGDIVKLCCVCCPSVVIAAVCAPSIMVGRSLVLPEPTPASTLRLAASVPPLPSDDSVKLCCVCCPSPRLVSAISGGSVTVVPPFPSDEIVKLCSVCCPSIVIVAVCVPSVKVRRSVVVLKVKCVDPLKLIPVKSILSVDAVKPASCRLL